MADMFNTYCMDFVFKKLPPDFNVVSNPSKNFRLIQVLASDGHAAHAVATCDSYIFDANEANALLLTQENMDWCCSDDTKKVKFISVLRGYEFSIRQEKLQQNVRFFTKLCSVQSTTFQITRKLGMMMKFRKMELCGLARFMHKCVTRVNPEKLANLSQHPRIDRSKGLLTPDFNFDTLNDITRAWSDEKLYWMPLDFIPNPLHWKTTEMKLMVSGNNFILASGEYGVGGSSDTIHLLSNELLLCNSIEQSTMACYLLTGDDEEIESEA